MYTHTFTTPGRYPYYCTLHGGAGGVGMAGVIVVGNASSTNISVADIVSHSQFHARTSPYTILHVPADFPTIQKAVDTAKPGDMVMIDPGVYHEAVTVHTPHITIRGRDRQSVIMEGDFKLSNAFKVVDGTDGVVIENMTARHYVGNGFFWDGVNGYRGSYLTAYANGDYGVYAYDSVMGQFDHDYAAGHPDSGFYIGQCHPCHAIIADVISEGNALGYSGTNAGGDLVIRDSIWRNNMSGITPNTLDSEKYPPEDGTTIINNLIENNSNYNAPTGKSEYPSIGNGIVIAGGNNNVIVGNRINGHIYYGVRIVPHFLQTTHACGSLLAYAGGGDPSVTVILFDHFMQISQGRVKIADWKKGIEPADAKNQPGMPDTTIDPQGIFTPIEGKPDMTISATTISPGITLGGLGLANPFFEVLLGFYAYFLPLALYGAWISVATWDIVRRTDLKDRARIGWMAVVYLIPVLGPLAYFLFGKSEISRNIRLALAIGAPLVYLVLLVVL